MAGVVDCWTKGPGVQVQVAENVVSLGDRHGPVIRLSSQRVLTDEQCVALCEQILSTTVDGGADLHVNRYQDERKFARVDLTHLKEVWDERVWRTIATDLVEPYFQGCLFFLASVSGFVVPPFAAAQVTHTDHFFPRITRGVVRGVRENLDLLVCRKLSYSAQNKCIVVHVPLDATSSVLGRTEWRCDTDKFGKHPPRASAWGHRGHPYAMNAGLWHGGSANGTSQPRVVLALRYLPAYISEGCWKDFVAHFQCSVVGHPEGPFGGVPRD